jgi:HlyD family secretion protein
MNIGDFSEKLYMDRKLSSRSIRSKRIKLTFKVAGALLMLIISVAVVRSFIAPSLSLDDVRTAVAETGDIEASVSASGIILPEFEEVLTSPVTSQILKVYRNVGDVVSDGDTILVLDVINEQLQLEKMLEELASKKNRITRMQLNMERSLTELQTTYEIQKLRTENYETHYNSEKYIRQLGGSTTEMVRQAELELQIARIEMERIRKGIDNHRESLITDMKDIEFEINIHQKNIQEVKRKIHNATVVASGKGVISYINDKIGTTVVAGSEIIKLANLNSFKAEGSVSDYYMDALSVNGKVKLILNDSTLTGQIVSVNPTVQNSTVKFGIRLENKSHPSLRSNQTVDIHISTSYKNDVVRLPRGNFNISNSMTGYMFVVNADKAERREVKFGESSFSFIEIKDGIKPGETVIVSNTDDIKHHSEIRLKTK